jgi:hypothetical protein
MKKLQSGNISQVIRLRAVRVTAGLGGQGEGFTRSLQFFSLPKINRNAQ